ncbi:RHS repeat-associated core domain-containing protein [Parahaliea mediterranea]|uniref:RHS repeat-associated core domain-containing protein n=1 Tax=Parahaliea mediterranea TaxID=651086 RepID=UPI000E2F3196|nr:RHS repeat-associated core domain-containing protein [Parahaliea mediterranea]
MNGRGYDYNLGRFLSVDPFIIEPGNSQALNPYSYVLNNPLSATDPTGYKAERKNKRKATDDPSNLPLKGGLRVRSPSTNGATKSPQRVGTLNGVLSETSSNSAVKSEASDPLDSDDSGINGIAGGTEPAPSPEILVPIGPEASATTEPNIEPDWPSDDGSSQAKGPGSPPAYSRSGIVEEIIVRARYEGAKLAKLKANTGIEFIRAPYRPTDPAGNQAARVLVWELKAIVCVTFPTPCSAYGAAETTANFVQNPNAMDATSLGYEAYKARFGGTHPVNQAIDMFIGELLGILPRE